MSEGYNRCLIFGSLGADPELRGGANAVLKLRVACSERYLDKASNEWKERTEWVSCCVFGKRAEGLAKVLKKGDRVFVEGSLHTSSYEKNGEKRYSTEVVAQRVILGGKAQSADRSGGASASNHGVKASNPYPQQEEDVWADDTPF